MKNWIKYIVIAYMILIVLPMLSSTAVMAGLTADQTNVDVTLHIPEGKTETITSLRFTLRVLAESGSMEAPSFQFNNAIGSIVKDASVTKQEDNSYLIDLILSGKKDQKIFNDSEDARIGTVSVKPTSEEYRVKVEYADTDLKYVDGSGISEEKVSLEGEMPAVVEYTKNGGSDTPNPPANTPENTVRPPSQKPVLKVSRKNKRDVLFEWEEVSDADGYTIDEYNSKKKDYEPIKTVNSRSITSFSKKYSYATTHSFRMHAFKLRPDGTKIYGTESAVVKVTLAPNQVKSFSAKVKNSKVNFSWKKVSGAKGYQIYCAAKKNGKYKLLKTVKKGKTTKATVKYKAGKKYYYKIRAYVTDSEKEKVYGNYSKVKRA